jgi:phosphopantothenoylcysteine synthetase/decarboxylase
VDEAQRQDWDVRLIATPSAVAFLDVSALEAQTGHAVRSEEPAVAAGGPAGSLPAADAIVVAPATYNTINKWARGISDNYALGILAEAIGLGIPIVVLPFVNAALAAHPAFGRGVATLRDAGVSIVLGPGEVDPHPPGTGGGRVVAWQVAVDRVSSLVAGTDPRDVD